MGVNAHKRELILALGKRRALAIPNMDKEELVLSVDFVEFADKSTWGAKTAKYAESLVGERASACAEAEQLTKLLKTDGLQAVKEAVAQRESR